MSKTFYFDAYDVKDDTLSFLYHYEDESGETIGTFQETYKTHLDQQIDTNDPMIQKILQHMHCLVGISYFKSLLGEVVLPYKLTQAEADYYNDIYDYGLGELKYVNRYSDAIRPFTASSQEQAQPKQLETSGAILGVGGGKDSIVAAEILKGIGIPTMTLSVGTKDHHGQAGVVMDKINLPQLHVERYVDTAISQFAKDYDGMRGHIPLSVLLAWVGALLAYIKKVRYVAMGNEGATSTGNVVWNGQEINHQWAKSLEQEKLTDDFIKTQVSPNIEYLSPIRPYSSLAVMELLAKLGKPYLNDFTSCNLVLRIDPTERPNGRWCTHCAKCVSTWLLLSSWLDDEQLVHVFGRNLWEDEMLKPTVLALLGLEGHKPLDCVGTIEELRAVTRKALEKHKDYPILAGITDDAIPGPSISELVASRSEHNIAHELYDQIEAFVATQLK
jgi:UDP-N-acetyl-alpha-D-muramoyl-L-alanyl-L-glutamate epimerase